MHVVLHFTLYKYQGRIYKFEWGGGALELSARAPPNYIHEFVAQLLILILTKELPTSLPPLSRCQYCTHIYSRLFYVIATCSLAV